MKLIYQPLPTLLLSILCSMMLIATTVDAEELSVRNPYNLDNSVQSKHFVVYWGSGVETSDVQELLDLLEYSWVELVEFKGFERPITTQNYKLNVYISGTGQVPYDDVKGGFAILDKEFHEAFILNKRALGREDLFLGATHEFFHTVQSSYGLIRSDAMIGVGWLVEALSNWAVPATWREHKVTAQQSLAQYAFYPQYSLDHINPSKPGGAYELLQGHQYGTYIFIEYLQEVTSDSQFVLKFLEYLKPLVAQTKSKNSLQELELFVNNMYGMDLKEVFASFIAKNAEWDYPERDVYIVALDRQRQTYIDEKLAQLHNDIDNTWHVGPVATLPRRWAANYIKLNLSEQNSIEIGFEGNKLGNEGNVADWKVTIVSSIDGCFAYKRLPLNEGKTANFEIDTRNASAVWITIAVTSQQHSLTEQFAYRYQFSHSGQAQPSPASEVSYQSKAPTTAVNNNNAASSSGGIFSPIWLLLLTFLIFIKQRQASLK